MKATLNKVTEPSEKSPIMKTHPHQPKLITVALLLFLAFTPCVHAQTNVGLNIQMYAGLSVTGTVGQVYQVQCAYGLDPTNTWYALQHFELKWNPHEFVDTTCPATERRFYRAVEVEVPTNVVPVANMVFIPGGDVHHGQSGERAGA